MEKTTEQSKYYVVRERAVPEVLLNVVAGQEASWNRKTCRLRFRKQQMLSGISRSSFYKYKDDIFPFHEEAKGKNYYIYYTDG